MKPPPDLRSPWGLGWTQRLALANAPEGCTVRELFDRQLLLGLMALSGAFWLFSAPLGPIFLPDAPLWVHLVPPVLGVFNLVLLLVFVSSGRNAALFGHVAMTSGFLVGVLGGIPVGGISVWTNPAWAFVYPIGGTLLDGVRGAVGWTVAVLVAFAALGGADAHYGWSAVRSAAGDDPAAQAGGLTMVAVFQGLLLTWFIQQRAIADGLVEAERKRTDALLNNVLPSSVVPRVKAGEVVADQQEEVTVVFADLVGFTTLAAGVPARRVVDMLAEVFGAIDAIAAEEGLEKVKTIGDCYMAVAGAPTPARDHADRALRFAARVRDAIHGRSYYGTPVTMRIGVHSGPVVAGILGEKRMLWDLWGDTVNTASRMESSGVAGEVHVSEATVRLLEGRYELEDRGVVQLKGRSGMRSWILRRPEGASTVGGVS